jgi:hypothetical protein
MVLVPAGLAGHAPASRQLEHCPINRESNLIG